MRKLRIAVCQIECHPAIQTGHITFLEEPFVPAPDGPSLSVLGTKGLDVAALQTTCLQEYSRWSGTRLRAILATVGDLPEPPDLVLLPETSVPVCCLPDIQDWAAANGVTVLAGSHTPDRRSRARKHYGRLGLDRKALNRMYRYGSSNALPVISSGRASIIPKRLHSIFERTDVSPPDRALPQLAPLSLQAGATDYDLLPLVCSEALQRYNVKREYQVVGIVSYDSNPDQFDDHISNEVRKKAIVAYCNDARWGGSMIHAPTDRRSATWLKDVLPTGLPPEDAILLVEVDLDARAVEVGTSSPATLYRLLNLLSIVHEETEAHDVTKALQRIRTIADCQERASQLQHVLEDNTPTKLQQIRIEQIHRVESRGAPAEDWWEALGHDCVIAGEPSLDALESLLARTCESELTKQLGTKTAQREEVAPLFMTYLAHCRELAAPDHESVALTTTAPTSVVDREREVSSILTFLDSHQQDILEVGGLPQIGKTCAIEKALSQSGISAVLRIRLSQTVTLDYLAYSLLRIRSSASLPFEDTVRLFSSSQMRSALSRNKVVVVENTHHLCTRGSWRDDSTNAALASLVKTAADTGTKIVFETRRQLPLDLPDPARKKWLVIHGLDKQQTQYGVAIFNAQLRRVDLDPAAFSNQDKATAVSKLGGHPVAIALAADIAYAEGMDSLLDALRRRKGFYLGFVGQLLRSLQLSDEELLVAQLLTLARAEVPRGAVLGAVDFPATPALRNLIAMGAVEVTGSGHVRLAGVLREYLDSRDMPRAVEQSFHEQAALAFDAIASRDSDAVWAAVEAEYHAGVATVDITVSTRLLDGAVATAERLYNMQEYGRAARVLNGLLKRKRDLPILRLAALAEAQRNRFDRALTLAKEVFARDRSDTRLLRELADIARRQYQADSVADELVAIARKAGMADDNILMTEGRLALRRNDLAGAEEAFQRAKALTRWNAWPYFFLGITYMREGRLDDAIDILHDGEEFCYDNNVRNRRVLNAIRTQLGVVYLYADRVDLAAPHIESVFEEDPESPETIRAYAALTIKRDGIKEAHKALARLREAKIRNRSDRCQFHLLYGLFYLGIDEPDRASDEFAKAHAADRTNVFVMMKQARTLWDLGLNQWMDGYDAYQYTLRDCATLVRKILEFDPDNPEGLDLIQRLQSRFPELVR